jgi:hypothetical protein
MRRHVRIPQKRSFRAESSFTTAQHEEGNSQPAKISSRQQGSLVLPGAVSDGLVDAASAGAAGGSGDDCGVAAAAVGAGGGCSVWDAASSVAIAFGTADDWK